MQRVSTHSPFPLTSSLDRPVHPNQGVFHIVGAGLAGMAAALRTAKAGFTTYLYEASPQAGGRCRSIFDAHMGCNIDLGSHLLLDCNQNTLKFLEETGGKAHIRYGEAFYPFMNLISGESWSVNQNHYAHGLWEGLKARGLPWCSHQATVKKRLEKHPSYEKLWKPLCLALLNTHPNVASAHGFAQALRSMPLQKKKLPRPIFFPSGLSAAFVEPTLKTLKRHGVNCLFYHRLVGFDSTHLSFSHKDIALGKNDWVILALPPSQSQPLLPYLPILETRGILNAHFHLPERPNSLKKTEILGLINGTSHWLFINDRTLSVTISDADSLFGLPQELLIAQIWRDLAKIVGDKSSKLPPYRLLKNRQATLCHSPKVMAYRPRNRIPELPHWRLAGDWLASPLPCSIESAIISGFSAANSLIFGK